MIRSLVFVCALLVLGVASAQTAAAGGARVVFFSIFGPDSEQLQKFYAGLFEWTIAQQT
jgi:hypothetical protein